MRTPGLRHAYLYAKVIIISRTANTSRNIFRYSSHFSHRHCAPGEPSRLLRSSNEVQQKCCCTSAPDFFCLKNLEFVEIGIIFALFLRL